MLPQSQREWLESPDPFHPRKTHLKSKSQTDMSEMTVTAVQCCFWTLSLYAKWTLTYPDSITLTCQGYILESMLPYKAKNHVFILKCFYKYIEICLYIYSKVMNQCKPERKKVSFRTVHAFESD